MEENKVILHGSAVSVSGRGVFLRGPSGSGKSDLCFRLLSLGVELVCDDQVFFERRRGAVFCAAAPHIGGLLELRGIGLTRYPPCDPVKLRLVIDLVPRTEVPRMPERSAAEILGVDVPRFALHAFDVSAAEKVLRALEITGDPALLAE